MKIAIIGAGSVGGTIADAVSRAGHTVLISEVNDDHAKAVADRTGGQIAASNADAAREADMVILAVPFQAVDEVTQELQEATAGMVVIDATNPLKSDYSGLAVTERAGAEHVQDRLPSASVVKAFNTIFATNHDQPVVDGMTLDAFLAGNDVAAKAAVADLLETIGFRAIDVGDLSFALALEHMAFLNISLNARHDLPWRSGWKLIGPIS